MIETIEALAAAIQADPREETPVKMLTDELQEAGKSPLAAKRAANKVARAARAAWLIDRAEELFSGAGAAGRRARARVRRAVGAGNHVPITVTGDGPPRLTGEPGRSEFKGGGLCRSPGAAIRAGYKVVYIASTEMITVGAEWVVDPDGRERR